MGLKTIGIQSKESDHKFESDAALQEFSQNVSYAKGRYEVSLPWKSDSLKSALLNNEKLAMKRLNKLHAKLDKYVELKTAYYKVFEDYVQEGIVEEIPSNEIVCENPSFYMPHRPVVKETSNSTKVRPVFDASASGYNGISLNDCLLKGPSLNPDLVEVMIRLRRWPIALTADVTKAFLQLCVKRRDRDVHCFLLRDEDEIKYMRFLRVPFGNTASPFLLNATI